MSPALAPLTSAAGLDKLTSLANLPKLSSAVVKDSNDNRDTRSPLAIGLEWAVRMTTIALEMALPGLGGLFVDWCWGCPLR